MTCHEVGHHLDGFASGLSTLQTECHERHIVDATHRVLWRKFMTSTKGGFGDSHLMFVDVAHHVVGHGSFGDFAQIFVRVAIDNASHCARSVCASRIVQQTSVHAVGVGTIGEIGFSVFGSLFATSRLVQADAPNAKRATKSSSIRFISDDFDDSEGMKSDKR